MSAIAYKLADVGEWERARVIGVFSGSAVDRRDGYIHLSTAEQLAETARRHYAGRDALVLAEIDLAAVGETVRWEPSRGGALFPHVHGPLPLAAVRRERRLGVDENGSMRFDDGEPAWP